MKSTMMAAPVFEQIRRFNLEQKLYKCVRNIFQSSGNTHLLDKQTHCAALFQFPVCCVL